MADREGGDMGVWKGMAARLAALGLWVVVALAALFALAWFATGRGAGC